MRIVDGRNEERWQPNEHSVALVANLHRKHDEKETNRVQQQRLLLWQPKASRDILHTMVKISRELQGPVRVLPRSLEPKAPEVRDHQAL